MTVTKNEVHTCTYTIELNPDEFAQLLRGLRAGGDWYKERNGDQSPNYIGIVKLHANISAEL
jgi:hypothetical protein